MTQRTFSIIKPDAVAKNVIGKIITSKPKASNSDLAQEILCLKSSGFAASLGNAKKDLNFSILSRPIARAVDSNLRWAFKFEKKHIKTRAISKNNFIFNNSMYVKSIILNSIWSYQLTLEKLF